MASGSHHSGSTHHGSYHSSSHSSHSSGTDSHSSKSHGTGSHSYGIRDESTVRRARLFVDGWALLISLLVCCVGYVNKFNAIYSVAVVLSALGISMCINDTYNPIGDMEGVDILKDGPSKKVHYFYNYRGDRKTLPKNQHVIVSDGKSWCSEKYYYFYFKDDYEVNKKVSCFLQTMPRVVFIEPAVELFLSIGLFIVGIGFYKLVIPLFESMTMSDEAFAIVDVLVYLFPFILVFCCGLACKLAGCIFHKRMRTFCECTLKEEKARRAIELHKQKINNLQDTKWYYNTCPSCGITNDDKATACSNCGVSLRITAEDFDKTWAHQVKDIETVSEAKEIED